MRHFEREGLIWTSGLDAESKLLLLALNQYLGSNQSAWPSMERLARDTSLGRSTIARRLKTLEEKGVVRVDRRLQNKMKTSSEYSIEWHALGVISISSNPLEPSKEGCIRETHPDLGHAEREASISGCIREAHPENQISLSELSMCQGDTQDVSGRHIDLIHRDLIQLDMQSSPHGDPKPLAGEGKPHPIAKPCSEREKEASTCGEDVAPSASATGEVMTEQEKPVKQKRSDRKKKPDVTILSGEDVQRVIRAYNENRSPHWSKLEKIGTDRLKILRKWLVDLDSLDTVIETMVKALKFAAQDDFWSGRTGAARRLNLETLNDKGHFISWAEDYERINRPKPKPGELQQVSPDLQAKFDRLKVVAEAKGHKVEPFTAMQGRFLLDGKIQLLDLKILDGLIDMYSETVTVRAS